MKSRKIKLLASLTSLVLVVAVMAVGVWAASTVTVNVTGTVSFGAVDNVLATVTTDKSGQSKITVTKDGTEGSPLTLSDLVVNAQTGEYVYTITIKNDRPADDQADKAKIQAVATANSASGTNYTVTVDNSGAASIAPNTTGTITVTFQVTNLEIATTADVGVSIKLDAIA